MYEVVFSSCPACRTTRVFEEPGSLSVCFMHILHYSFDDQVPSDWQDEFLRSHVNAGKRVMYTCARGCGARVFILPQRTFRCDEGEREDVKPVCGVLLLSVRERMCNSACVLVLHVHEQDC